jgi:hypothetical protein
MIRDLIRLGGGSVVHAADGPGKALCSESPFAPAVTSSWEGDTSEITCLDCRRLVDLN